jgi:mannose-6-phosphate isomerase-like protein (cupin superfamily)
MRPTLILIGAVLFVLRLPAQEPKPNPTCSKCSATYISADEIQTYLNRAPARANNSVADQQVRAIDVGKANVDIGVVYRSGKQTEGSAVAEHDQVSEVYHVLDGAATLVTGSDIVDWKPRPADNEAVRLLNGPGGNGASIRNGATYELKAGDVIVIPAGVGHWFTKIDDHIRYLMIRVDPDKLTPLKDQAASQADLRRAGAR